ncbi:cbb3-type cytochrome oxidase assembly protein CcoS [Marinicellulosiphila megalodicopiae]|uniref:cbb3-type cytochrome oxidase assembly protein CcoS n=1 Tax=Marinicellulosiphila megalodicopiae TaxID=2724896 RepID=UPI003BB0508A
MDILYLLIPVTLGLLTVAVGLFYWTVKSGQYDDLDSQAHRILFDNEEDEKMMPPEVRIKKDKPTKTEQTDAQ